MITKILTIAQLKQLFLEIFINKTDKISDISDNSVVNATGYGVSKVAQKCMKDIAIVESHIFPDSAYGTYLDSSATLFGAPARGGALGSSTYVRIVANPGTQYVANTHVFSNYNGIQFNLESTVTVGDLGFVYAKVRSIDTGNKTNVEPNSIISVSPQPAGHVGVTNEYMSTGGSDIEDDELFRMRIKKHLNILARNTLEYFTEVFRRYNSNILRLINLGNNEDGDRVIGIVTQNGIDLSQTELDELLESTKDYFCLTDLNKYGTTIGIALKNADWFFVDMDFRVQILSNYDPNEVRKEMQIGISKYLDFRTWKNIDKVEWDNLLQIVKSTKGVKYVPDTNFTPNRDLQPPINKLPRVRGFIMRDMSGNIISDSNNVLTPVFYPIV
jgi:hypothetical protein